MGFFANRQELCALGIANLFGAFFNCYTTTGSFSRSAVNDNVGAQSRLSCFVTGLLLLLTLTCLTPLFTNMPQNVQGAIIIVGVSTLFQFRELLLLIKVNFLDALVWVVAFGVVLFAGVELGIAISIALSVVVVFLHSVFPPVARLGRLPGTPFFRNVGHYPEAAQVPGVLVARVDAPIFFANVQHIRGWIEGQITKEEESLGNPIQLVILDLGPVPIIDATALHELLDFVDRLHENGRRLFIANPSLKVTTQLVRGRILQALGDQSVFVSVEHAVAVFARQRGSLRPCA